MSKSRNQKLKIIYLMQILLEKTDENHLLTVNDLIAELAKYDISAERKTIYDDIELLCQFGLDIVSVKSKTWGYFVGKRDFELPELKLLVDAVQASKFITHKKSEELIDKLQKMTSIHEAKQLERQVHIPGRVKTLNESIYYNIDKIHTAIAEGNKVSFRYFEYNLDKRRHYRRNGERYMVSPHSLTWHDDNYYLIAIHEKTKDIKHFRVDKMIDIKVEDMPINASDNMPIVDIASYSRKMFGMFSGEEDLVKIRFENSLIGVVIDRFGEDVKIDRADERNFYATIRVVVSPVFLSWIFQFKKKAKIMEPYYIADMMKTMIEEVSELYKSVEVYSGKT